MHRAVSRGQTEVCESLLLVGMYDIKKNKLSEQFVEHQIIRILNQSEMETFIYSMLK